MGVFVYNRRPQHRPLRGCGYGLTAGASPRPTLSARTSDARPYETLPVTISFCPAMA